MNVWPILLVSLHLVSKLAQCSRQQNTSTTAINDTMITEQPFSRVDLKNGSLKEDGHMGRSCDRSKRIFQSASNSNKKIYVNTVFKGLTEKGNKLDSIISNVKKSFSTNSSQATSRGKGFSYEPKLIFNRFKSFRTNFGKSNAAANCTEKTEVETSTTNTAEVVYSSNCSLPSNLEITTVKYGFQTNLYYSPVKSKFPEPTQNTVTLSYEEEPETQYKELKTSDDQKGSNVLVINAPDNLRGLPVIVVPDRNNDSLRLTLKKDLRNRARWPSAKLYKNVDSVRQNHYHQRNRPQPVNYRSRVRTNVSETFPRGRFNARSQHRKLYDIRRRGYHRELAAKPILKHTEARTNLTSLQSDINKQLIEQLLLLMRKKVITRQTEEKNKLKCTNILRINKD